MSRRTRDPRLDSAGLRVVQEGGKAPGSLLLAYRAAHTALVAGGRKRRLDGAIFGSTKNRDSAIAQLSHQRAIQEPSMLEGVLGISVGAGAGRAPKPSIELRFPSGQYPWLNRDAQWRRLSPGYFPVWGRAFGAPYEYGWTLHAPSDTPSGTWTNVSGSYPTRDEYASAADGLLGVAVAGAEGTPWTDSWLLGDAIVSGAVIQQSTPVGAKYAFPVALLVGADLSWEDPWPYHALLGLGGTNPLPVCGIVGTYWLTVQVVTDAGMSEATGYTDFLYLVAGPNGLLPAQSAQDSHVNATVNLPPAGIRWVTITVEADLQLLRGGRGLPNSAWGVASFQVANHARRVSPILDPVLLPIHVDQMWAEAIAL